MAATPGPGNGPLAAFCAGLRALQEASGLSRAALAARLRGKVSQTQVYAVLAGEIKRPPSWTRTVEPIVRICAGGDMRALSHWRRRHDVLVAVCQELDRERRRAGRSRTQPAPTKAVRMLRADTAAFTGRTHEIEVIRQAVIAPAPGQAMAIHAIDGMPGVGKTALAVHVGHTLADRFPDGQIFVDLHGYSADHEPADPGEVLAGLLRSVGLQPGEVPDKSDERAAKWRDATAGQRLLLILDNAASDEQVIPLLPASPRCLVLVTSRSRLMGLRREYGASILSLSALPEPAAIELFARISGHPPDADHDEIVSLVRACGHLPLAITVLAASLDPGDSLADLRAEFDDAQDYLAVIDAHLGGRQRIGVAGAFELSYRGLAADSQRLLRLLAASPTVDFDVYAAAALTGQPVMVTRTQLTDLNIHRLIDQPAHGRYRLHDLLKIYIRTRSSPEEADAAVERLLDYYQDAAEAAGAYLVQYSRPMVSTRITRHAALPSLSGRQEANEWMAVDRVNLLAAIGQARARHLDSRVAGLVAGVAGYLRATGPWTLAIELHGAARTAARRLGDGIAEANALHDLGLARYLAEDYPGAADTLQQSMDLYQALGSRSGTANVLTQLGAVRRVTGDLSGAAAAFQRALNIYHHVGDRLGEANVRQQLGALWYMTDDYPAAAAELQRAIDMYRQIGHQPGEANALIYLGAVRDETGDYPAAIGALQLALAIYRQVGDKLGEANTLNQLGAAWQATGEYPAAIDALQRALEVYRQVGNQISEANALNRLGAVWLAMGNTRDAVTVLGVALDIFRGLGNRLGEADVLSDLGDARTLIGDFSTAAIELTQALEIFRELGNRLGETQVLNRTGKLYLARHQPERALECHEQARGLASSLHSLPEEARAIEGAGRSALMTGNKVRARKAFDEALRMYQRAGSADAARLAAELEPDDIR